MIRDHQAMKEGVDMTMLNSAPDSGHSSRGGLKIAALCWAGPHLDYLESCVRSVLPGVDSVLVGLGRRLRDQAIVAEQIGAVKSLHSQVGVVEGEWEEPGQWLKATVSPLLAQGMTHLLLLDPQHVYAHRDLTQILEFVGQNPQASQFHVTLRNYWKSPAYRIEPADPEQPAVVIRLRAWNEHTRPHQLSIPETVGCVHCFSYASPTRTVQERLAHSGLPADSIKQWKREVWLAWDRNRAQRDLHPVAPTRFRSAVRINSLQLPEALYGHPYLAEEIAGRERKAKPRLSLIFSAERELQRIQAFLDDVTRTCPHDCELIAGVPPERADVKALLESKPGARIVVTKTPARLGTPALGSAWNDCVAASEGHSLVFVSDALGFEGDWLEGFQAGLESDAPAGLYAAKIGKTASSSPCSPGQRYLEFEQERGRFYGRRGSVAAAPKLEDLHCFGCLRDVWKAVYDPLALEAQPARRASTLAVQVLEDTLVFDASASLALIPEVQPSRSREEPADKPKVSIVIPVYNNLSYTRACLDSLFRHTADGTYEVIVVDNGSTDGTRDYLESLAPRVRTIRNIRNLFFARGCNRGGWAARGENLLFLNNDVVVTPGWLDEMLKVLDQDPQIGIVGNKQLFPESHSLYPGRVWHAGIITTPDKAPLQVYYGFDPQHPLVNQQRDYPAVIGSCFLIRRRLFEELGGFDPVYQNGHEETDLCLRASLRGHRVVYTPRSEITHFVSSSESRFDREAANLRVLRERWGPRWSSSEAEVYRAAGLLPSPSDRTAIRVGFVSTFLQKCRLSDYAEQLLSEYPARTTAVLSESAIWDHRGGEDPPEVIRAWNRNCDWYYPLLRWADSLDLDVVHLNFGESVFPPGLLDWLSDLRRQGKRVVVTFHQTAAPSSPAAQICAAADAVVVHTLAGRLNLMVKGCESRKIRVIPPGLPKTRKFDGRRARARQGIRSSQKVLATPGFITPEKGVLEVIQALPPLCQEMDVIYLVLGGLHSHRPEGVDYLTRCKETAHRLGVARRVFFYEEFLKTEEMQEMLSCADAVVLPYGLPSNDWSSSAALALALERPVVGSYHPSFSSFSQAVLPAWGGVSLVQAVQAVLHDTGLVAELASRGTACLQAHSWRKAAEAHWRLYQGLVTNQPWDDPAQGFAATGRPTECLPTVATAVTDSRSPEPDGGEEGHGEWGVSWSGAFYDFGELSDSARDLTLATARSHWPACLVDYSTGSTPLSARTLLRLNQLNNGGLQCSFLHVDQRPCAHWERRSDALRNIARWNPMLDRSSAGNLSRFRLMDEIWVPSQAAREACLVSGIKPSSVFSIPETVEVSRFRSEVRPYPIPGHRRFNFLSMLEESRLCGWDLLLEAFLQEFKPSEDVTLVLKLDSNPGRDPQRLVERISHFIRSRLGKDPATLENILLLNQPLSPEETVQLYKSCQAFVRPSRSAQVERCCLAAMASGLPLIGTADRYDSEWLHQGNAYPLEPLPPAPEQSLKDISTFSSAVRAEPSLDQLRELMRRLVLNPEQARAVGAQAQKDVERNFGADRVSSLVSERLRQIAESVKGATPHPAPTAYPRRSQRKTRPHLLWEGPQLLNHSLALVNRELELALMEEDSVDLSVSPVGADVLAGLFGDKSAAIMGRYGKVSDQPVDVHVRHQWPPNWSPPREGHFVVIQPWEYGSLPVEWVREVNRAVDEVWVPSGYVRNVYVESGVSAAKVQVIPNGFDPQIFRPGLKPYPLQAPDKFKFLFLGGTIYRKGVDLLLEAYRKAFWGRRDVLLVIKDMGTRDIYQGQGFGDKIREMQKDPQGPLLHYLDTDLADGTLASLYAACDCLVHPYRGEGFGLPVLEAMACGLPVIVTAGGATDDFVDDHCGFRISADKRSLGKKEIGGFETAGTVWMLEPSLEGLTQALESVEQDRAEARRRGLRGQEQVHRHWTWRESAQKVVERIAALQESPVVRFQEQVDTAVLVEAGDPGAESLEAVALTLGSLQKNSYVQLKMYLRTQPGSALGREVVSKFPWVKLLHSEDWLSNLCQIRTEVRAPFLAVVRAPLLFSKQWIGQLSSAATRAAPGPKVVAPSSNVGKGPNWVSYPGNGDECAFHKFARGLWRQNRGCLQEMSFPPSGCAVVSWDCLNLPVGEEVTNFPDWLAALRQGGVKMYWARDTFVGRLEST